MKVLNRIRRLPLSLLIVEDDPDVRAALRASARMCFAETVAAATLNEALIRLDSHRFDIVLLDFDLPDADGTVSVPAVRFRHDRAAIIGMSSETENDPVMLRLGAEGFLTKPFGIDELAALANRLMPTTSPEFDLPLRQAA